MNFDNYADVRSEKRSDLEGLKSRLPESVRNIVFASEVCIKSVESRRYLYSPNDYKDFQFGSDRRYVFTWPLVGYSGQSWKIEPNGDNVYLKNVDYGRYLYSPNDYKDFQFESDSRYVFTWPSVGYSGQSWKIEPNGDNVYLKNVDYGRYLYSPDGRCMNHFQDCDPDRRYIFTSSQNLETNQFKWKIEDCSSTVRKRRSQVAGGSFNRSIIEPPVCNASVNSHFEEDVEINAQDVFGRKPIHIATVNNNKNAIELFLSKKVSIDDTDEYGLTPLYYASWYGHLDLIKYLVENGADINVRGEGGETALDAAIDKKHDDVEMYLKQVQLDERLLIAVQYGNFDEVKDFVSQGASLGAKYSDGRALMHWATYGGKLDIVKYLVDKGANINAKDKNGRVSLHYATYNGKLDIVKYFIDEKNININIKDSDGLVPLHFASSGGHLGIIEYLIGKGANINAKDKNGQTPLDFAVQKGYANIVQIIEQRLGLDKELLIAVQENNLDKVKDLINQGASINAKDEDGKTPLHYASQSIYSLDIVRYLISKGADIDVKDNSGSTPENEADGTHSSTMRQVFMQAHLDKELLLTVKNEKDLKTISDLIAKDIDDRTHGGFYYTWSGNLGTVELLVSTDVSVNATDKYGCTLLHWSALKGHSDIAKFLVDNRANVNAKDVLGRTPMHFAVMNNHSDMLHYLINNRANIGVKDSSGKTPLDIAKDKGHNNIVEYLERKLREGRGGRKCRHLDGDHSRHYNHLSRKPLAIDSSNQPEIAASSGTRSFSWINSCISWAKSLAASTFSIIPGLPTQYNIADKNNVKSDNKNIPQSTVSCILKKASNVLSLSIRWRREELWMLS